MDRLAGMDDDLRNSDYIIGKVKDSDSYAQNLYAAMCNNDFVKNNIWGILKDETWHCSWRAAGRIISELRESGDYMDYYCSGLREDYEAFIHYCNGMEYDHIPNPSNIQATFQYVQEGEVTDEVREDLLNIGWTIK